MLSVRDERRSRSKSPGGRDRDRSRSRDERSPARKERRSSKYSPSGSEAESADDRRSREKRSSKKYYDEDSEDDRRRSHKSSKKYRDEASDDERHKSSRSSKYRDESASEDDRDRRRDKGRREKKRSDESESDRRSSRKDKSSRNKDRDSESDSEDDTRHRRSKKESDRNGQPQYGQPPYGYPPGYAPGYAPPAPGAYQDARHMSYVPGDPRYAQAGGYMPPPAVHQRAGSFSGGQRYADVDKYQYAQPDPNNAYKAGNGRGDGKQYIKTYNARGEPQLIELKGEYDRKRPDKDKKYIDDKYDRRDKDDHRNDRRDERSKKYNDDKYGSSPDDVRRRMSQLAVGGALGAATLGVAAGHGSHNGGKPPASPLLEAYRGTYQSMSPMPSALVLRGNDSDLSDLDLGSDISGDSDDPNADLKRKIKKLEKEKAAHQKERHGKSKPKRRDEDSDDDDHRSRQNSMIISPRSSDNNVSLEARQPRGRVASDASVISPVSGGKRRVMFYDATSDAKKLAAALEGTHKPAQTKPLIEILPGLSDDDIMALRLEYKTVAKVGGQGINIAKHIKMRVPGNLGKACYATALGRWESEAYWANSWYQGGATRRELLIESLMGRSNSDIREIKNCFKDKRYNDDLERCMKAELKADKFRTAILLALEERRLPESSPLDMKQVREDVQDLYHALSSQGGETAMIEIIVVRSDQHLREVLKVFEKTYKVNFARAMIDKSRNLVGETLAHVLNGALNRPMRDALLLHQAISETAPGKERAELLISRLVRLHWEPKHLEKVKAQYEARYQMPVEVAIRREVMAQMKTEEGRSWAEFCVELVRSSA